MFRIRAKHQNFAIFTYFLFLAASPTWGEWGEWSDCTVTCGGGTRTREKSCDDTDTNDSETCEGDTPTETENCNEEDCRKF